MNIVPDSQVITASEARDKLYSLIKDTATGLKTFEIILRGSSPVILMNKAELDAWQETLDILSNKKEISLIRIARKEKKTVSHKELLRKLKINNEN